MSVISMNGAQSKPFLRANADLALSALVSITGLVVNFAIVSWGLVIV
jgi:hypothetical protein